MLFRIVLCRRRNFLSKYFCYFIVILLLFFVFANQMTGQKQIGLVKQNQENEFIKLFESQKLTYVEFIEKQDHLLANRSIINSATVDIVYEALIARDNLNIIPGLGEGGIPANLEDDLISIAEDVMKKEAMNLILSDKISLTRSLRDPRNPLCKTVTYDRYLPSASVIIIFTNEALSPLLRTVHSVLNRSPPQFLHELILVDDFSDRAVLKGKLEYYVKTRFPSKVRLMRLSERSGLIRTRLAGARVATGDVLVFLDSHCEVFDSWLEPLLQRIKESRTSVLTPLIDVIDHKTLEYKLNFVDFQIGGFSWSGHFTWIPVPPEEDARRDSPIAPARSPTMAGGLLALERNFFWEIGSYDDGMDVWGGENLEMSFRVWQCGGTLETIPCSRVGHIFRSFHPYTFPGGKDTHGINTVRVAEVWMDEYKKHFYTHRPDLLGVDYGDISRRVEFRKKKKCKSFKWFLQNVYPQMFIPDENVQAFGKVQSLLCLDTLQRANKEVQYILGVYSCHKSDMPSQFMSLTNTGELRHEEMCAEIQGFSTNKLPLPVTMYVCHGQQGNQMWLLSKAGEIKNQATGLCLDSAGLKSGDDVVVTTCSDSPSQMWVWSNYS